MREAIKRALGRAVAGVLPQCRYERSIFVLAHMRCGSTALSNILCSRPEISGYGEAHIRHDSRAALGRLVVNQALRGAFSPRAPLLFDKLLHNRHDSAAPPEFFAARAIFIARPPGPTIRSIRKLYAGLGRAEYGTDQAAAAYYIARMEALATLWPRFAPELRVALTHATLLVDPEASLGLISDRLGFTPPLANHYASPKASRRGGGGDPLASGRHSRIVPAAEAEEAGPPLELPADIVARAEALYGDFEMRALSAG